jgi:biopolymer transport protein ExbD
VNLRPRARGRRAEATIDITSLVDVVFLLLIFLLVTTTFKRQEHAFPIELPTSAVEQVTVTTDKTTVFITRDGRLRLLTVPLDVEEGTEATASVEEVTPDSLSKRLAALYARRPHTPIAIRGERETRYQRMIDVISLIEEVGFRNIWFPYDLEGGP